MKILIVDDDDVLVAFLAKELVIGDNQNSRPTTIRIPDQRQ